MGTYFLEPALLVENGKHRPILAQGRGCREGGTKSVVIPNQQESGRPIHILVVEDEPLIRAVLAEYLRDKGFIVVEAVNGDDAFAYVCSNQPVDLVFTDIQMPGSIDGIELVRKLRGFLPSLPIIVTSGAVGPESIDEQASFIAKPYRQENAVSLVCSALGLNS